MASDFEWKQKNGLLASTQSGGKASEVGGISHMRTWRKGKLTRRPMDGLGASAPRRQEVKIGT
jgi:hypothetical protein